MLYNVMRSNIAIPASPTPILAIIAGATRSFWIVEIDFQGFSDASAPNEVGLCLLSSAGVGSPGALADPVIAVGQPHTSSGAVAFSGLANTGVYGTSNPGQ